MPKWRQFSRVFSSLRSEDGAPLPIFRPSLSFAPHISRAIRSLNISSIRPPQTQACPRSCPNPSRLPTKPQIWTAYSKPRCFRCGRQGHLARSCGYSVRCFQCGNIGHKRASCHILPKERSTNCLPTTFGDGEGDDVIDSFRSTGIVSHLREDCMLLDPDVANYLGKGKVDRGLQGSEGLQLELKETREVILKASDQVCLTSKGCCFAVDSLKLGKFLGKDYGLVASRKFKHRLEDRSVLGKGRKPVASFGLIQSAKLWISFGKGGISPKFSVPKPIFSDNLQLLNECSTASLTESIGVELDKGPEIVPPPAPFDVISSREIIDDFEDGYSKDEDGPDLISSLSSLSMDQSLDKAFCSEEDPPPEPSHMVKEVAAMPPNQSSKTVSTASIRRSPRLNKALCA